MSVTLDLVQSSPANITSFWPFRELRLFSGQVTGDGSGGVANMDMSVLVSGEARHVYLLRCEVATSASNWGSDFAPMYRSVNPQWNISTSITTGISLVKMFPLNYAINGVAGPSGIVEGQDGLPIYVGQVASAGTSLLRLTTDNVNTAVMSTSILLGTSVDFLLAPPNTWPQYS